MYTSREYDAETGLYFYRARYYDPTIGRFISADPIGFSGGINFYGYVMGNPINAIDPSGHEFSYGYPSNPEVLIESLINLQFPDFQDAIDRHNKANYENLCKFLLLTSSFYDWKANTYSSIGNLIFDISVSLPPHVPPDIQVAFAAAEGIARVEAWRNRKSAKYYKNLYEENCRCFD